MADDTLEGVVEIAPYIGKTERQTFYLCENKRIPAFKLAGKWHMRKSTYRRRIEELEAESAAGREGFEPLGRRVGRRRIV